MTGRRKGAKQENKTTWFTTCRACHSRIENKGSGRGRNWCDQKCHKKDPAVKATMRANSKRNYWRNRAPSNCWRRETNKQILNAEKLQRGECALHPSYNNGERKFVIPGLEYLFDMDHLDRHEKHQTIAKMMGSPEKRFRLEMSKCQMVCVECHRRKTVENKDWVQIIKVLQPEMQVVYNQPTLFDN